MSHNTLYDRSYNPIDFVNNEYHRLLSYDILDLPEVRAVVKYRERRRAEIVKTVVNLMD